MNLKKIVCVIPARLHSKRFPKKILADLSGKPLIVRVYEKARQCPQFDTVICAIDDEETARILSEHEIPYVMTSSDHPSGTSRLAEVCLKGEVQGDIWVAWQSDTPFISPSMIEELLSSIDDANRDIWTLKKKISNPKPSDLVKVVTDSFDRALYFSRAIIPHPSHSGEEAEYFKHVGIYAYRAEVLKTFLELTPSPLEICESLEQLRFLSAGYSIYVHTTKGDSLGIDLHSHLEDARKLIS